jgi:hypothetical protein
MVPLPCHKSGQAIRMGHTWRVRGDLMSIFRLVADARTFPAWMRVVKHVEPTGGSDEPVVGATGTMRVRSLLPYGLRWDIRLSHLRPGRVVHSDCRVTLGGRVSLHGRVSFHFERDGDDHVIVTNDQEMALDRGLPRWLAPLAAWAFRLNHWWALSRARRELERLANPVAV